MNTLRAVAAKRGIELTPAFIEGVTKRLKLMQAIVKLQKDERQKLDEQKAAHEAATAQLHEQLMEERRVAEQRATGLEEQLVAAAERAAELSETAAVRLKIAEARAEHLLSVAIAAEEAAAVAIAARDAPAAMEDAAAAAAAATAAEDAAAAARYEAQMAEARVEATEAHAAAAQLQHHAANAAVAAHPTVASKRSPPWQHEEIQLLRSKLPLSEQRPSEVAQELNMSGMLPGRSEVAIKNKLVYLAGQLTHGGTMTDRTFAAAFDAVNTQKELYMAQMKAYSSTLSDIEHSARCNVEYLPTGAMKLPPNLLGALYSCKHEIDSSCVETYDDESMLQTSGSLHVPPMHHGQPTWVIGRKGEMMVKVLVEIVYELQAELIVQASYGGADVHAFDPVPVQPVNGLAFNAAAAMGRHAAAIIEVKTVPIKISRDSFGRPIAVVHVDRVRPKQSTVLFVVAHHPAGVDFFACPTPHFIGNREGARLSRKLSRTLVDAAQGGGDECACMKDVALMAVMCTMLGTYRHVASYRRPGQEERLLFWNCAAARLQVPLWSQLAPTAASVRRQAPSTSLPAAVLPCLDDVEVAEGRLLLGRVAACSTPHLTLTEMTLLPWRRTRCYANFMAALNQWPDYVVQIGFHGTKAVNIDAIAAAGLDPSLRKGQVHGAGEYFGETINLSLPYMQGASRLLVFLLLVPRAGTTGHGLVYRGHGTIVIDDASMQLPIATVEVTHMGSMAEAEAAKAAEAEAAEAEAEAAKAVKAAKAAKAKAAAEAAEAAKAAKAKAAAEAAEAAEAAKAAATTAAAAAAAATAAAAAAAAVATTSSRRSQEWTSASLVAFTAKQKSDRAAAALHAANQKVPQRYPCDHVGCDKSFSQSGNLYKHKRTAHGDS